MRGLRSAEPAGEPASRLALAKQRRQSYKSVSVQIRATAIELLLTLLAALGTGCTREEQRSECWSARQSSRDAVVNGKLEQAQKLLEQARTLCAGQSADDLRRIEELIADRREVARAVAKDEAEAQHAHGFPTEQFMRWATEPAERFSHSLSGVECAVRGDPAYGFCEAERKGSPDMKVRYWEHDRKAVRYSFRTKLPLECEDLGDHRVVRRWSLGAESFELCELTERKARELSALLVRGSGENRMYIFSFAYLRKDPAFDLSLRRPGGEFERK